MDLLDRLPALAPALPPALMALAALVALRPAAHPAGRWQAFHRLSIVAVIAALGLALHALTTASQAAVFPALLAVLVQWLGTVIGAFSARYLQGEPRQARYVAALAGVLAAVQTLLLADHWLLLIAAWAAVGAALERLLCFYADRPFALLAAHKKHLADRAADVLLLGAAALAWHEVGSGSLSDLAAHLRAHGASPALQCSAVLLAAAVILRTALLPVHGWLIQVMEAPTPVSALLHAGVVNLGGFMLIRFAPLLEHAVAARALLVAVGLGTAVLAGLVMLTRISIKVRLAWSTVAQMGFMVLECGLGLSTLAALHLVGHSLYKAHAFLSAPDAVRRTRQQALRGTPTPHPLGLLLAPVASTAVVVAVQAALGGAAWPWWWSGVLALAWAPLLWWPKAPMDTAPADRSRPAALRALHALSGLALAALLTAVARLAHALPWGLTDAPAHALGVIALAGMALLYLGIAALQTNPPALAVARRWSYAGFYLDEYFTRAALKAWPARWTPEARSPAHARATTPLAPTA